MAACLTIRRDHPGPWPGIFWWECDLAGVPARQLQGLEPYTQAAAGFFCHLVDAQTLSSKVESGLVRA